MNELIYLNSSFKGFQEGGKKRQGDRKNRKLKKWTG